MYMYIYAYNIIWTCTQYYAFIHVCEICGKEQHGIQIGYTNK